jgi:hypothetical protein
MSQLTRAKTLTIALVLGGVLGGAAIGHGATDDAADRAESAAQRAEAAAARSEEAARRVEAAAERLERLIERLDDAGRTNGRAKGKAHAK